MDMVLKWVGSTRSTLEQGTLFSSQLVRVLQSIGFLIWITFRSSRAQAGVIEWPGSSG